MKKFFTNKKKIWFIVLSSLIIYAVSFNNVFADGVAADLAKDKINSVIGEIAYLFLVALSSISVVFIKMIVVVAQYNQFIDSPAVISGWVIARDVCNMAFIVILLVIAFGVILRVPNYNLKQIPKLLLFAILINFSKTFCGLIIDIAQVVMLTFVSSFSASGGGYFTNALKMVELFSFSTSTPITGTTTTAISPFNTTVGAITGVVAAFVTLVVLGVFLAVLVIRIVMIWIYVILSPFAFLGFAFDPIKAKTGKIWGDFINQVISGPILAFFLWLALSIAATAATPAGTANADSPAPLCVGITAFFCEVTFQKFIFTIGMLVGGLMVTQSLGGAIGSMAGKGLGAISKGKSMAWTGVKKAAVGGAKATAREGWAQIQKTELGRSIVPTINKFKSAGGAGTGAVIGSAFGGPVGTLLGAAAGGFIGKKISTRLDNRWKSQNARLNASSDKGEFLDENGKKADFKSGFYSWSEDKRIYQKKDDENGEAYKENGVNVSRWGEYEDEKGRYGRRNEKDDKYYKVDAQGNFIDKEGNKTSEVSRMVKAKSAFDRDVTEMDDSEKKRWAGYASTKNKTKAAADAVVDEKISKEQKNYSNMSPEMLSTLLDVEKDKNKKMAVSMELAVKKGFKDASEVIKAKDALGGNSSLSSKFDNEMNKHHMVMNNMKSDGRGGHVLDKAKIAKLVSSGDSKWEDQDWSTMNKESMSLMATQLGLEFGKKLDASIKTTGDKEKAKQVLGTDIREREFDKTDGSIRKAYAKLSGKFTEAYTKKNDEVNTEELTKMFTKLSKVDILGKVDEKDRKDLDFRKAFADGANIKMIQSMNVSPDISEDVLRDFVSMIKESNKQLFEEIKGNEKLKHLTAHRAESKEK